MIARHAAADPPEPEPNDEPAAAESAPQQRHPMVRAGVERTARRLLLLLAVLNALVGGVLASTPPGTSPALQFLASLLPLWVWGAGFLASSALLLIRFAAGGHALAAFLWLLMASGAVVGLVTGASTAPAASLILALLIATMAVCHVLALLFRRRLDRLPS